MKNKLTRRLIIAAAFLIGTVGVAETFRNDKLKFGKPSTGANKVLEFDTNDGASNKKITINGVTKNLSANVNEVTLGSGAAGDKKLIFDIGAGANNPLIQWTQAGSVLQFSNDGTIFNDLGGGGGGGGGGVAGIESAEQRCELARTFPGAFGVDEFDQGVCQNYTPQYISRGILLQQLTAASSSAIVAWDPLYLDPANPDSNFDAAITAVTGTDATNVNTNASVKIGSSVTSWDKTGSDTDSCIQKDMGASNVRGVGGYGTVLIWFSLPTTTNFSNFALRASAGAANPANYAEFRKTTVVDIGSGTSPTTGYQLVTFNLYATPDATAGTGWLPGDGLRTLAICTNWSSAAQVATDMLFDGLVFIPNTNGVTPEYRQLVQKGDRFTIANSSTVEFNAITVGSADVIGPVTLATAAANTYSGGSASSLWRSTLEFTSNQGRWNTNTALTSGAVSLAQSSLSKKVLKESLSNASINASINFDSPLGFTVKQIVSGTQFKVHAPVDFTAQMLNTHVMHVCDVVFQNGKRSFQCDSANNRTLTANSTFASSEITFTIADTTGMSVGQWVWKANQADLDVSLVANGTAETFTSAAPSEVLVMDNGLPYPAQDKLVAHYHLGGYNTAEATRNRQSYVGSWGNLQALNSGPSSTSSVFKNGQLAASGFTGNNGYQIPHAALTTVCGMAAGGATPCTYSIWLKRKDTAAAWYPLTQSNAINDGVFWTSSGTNGISINALSGFGTVAHPGTYTTGEWFHYVISRDGASNWNQWLNGVKQTFSGGTNGTSTRLEFGAFTASATDRFTQGEMADFAAWNKVLTDDEVLQIYNGSAHRVLGSNAAYKYRYEFGPLTGQKASGLAQIFRTTTGILPFINKVVFQVQ